MTRPVFTVLVQVLLLLATSSAQTTPTQKPAHPPKTAQPKTESHASWTDYLEKNFGITQKAFQEMGFGNLTWTQEIDLLAWVTERERLAKAAVPVTSFDCGRQGEPFADAKPESYDRVRVYVDAAGNATEVISGVRERLRAMNGTEVVYSPNEADLKASLVATQMKSKGGYDTGSALSVIVSRPCAWTQGTNTSHIDSIENQFVQVGSDVKPMVDSIVSDIDTNDFEPQRQVNALLRKMLDAKTKK